MAEEKKSDLTVRRIPDAILYLVVGSCQGAGEVGVVSYPLRIHAVERTEEDAFAEAGKIRGRQIASEPVYVVPIWAYVI